MDLLGSKDVQDELKETARIYFTSPDVTINLIWAVLILGLLGLGESSSLAQSSYTQLVRYWNFNQI